MSNVLLISELLIKVLECLPISDLLHAQRVCYRFQDIIKKTRSLQQALFIESKQRTGTEINTLLQSKFPCWFISYDKRAPRDLVPPNFYGRNLSNVHLDALTRSDASWRKMLICQPPKTEIHITECPIKGVTLFFKDCGVLDYSRVGLRMGHIHDIAFSCLISIQKFRKAIQPSITFGLDWHSSQELDRVAVPNQGHAEEP